MARKKNNLLSKIVMIGFLVMIILGFMIPGFIDVNEQDNGVVQPRLCNLDSDCYLLCGEKMVKVLCSENLCQQNSCEQAVYYPFSEEALEFSLSVKAEEEINLAERIKQGNIFVTFEDDKVKSFSDLTLKIILEKFALYFNSNCLYVDNEEFCSDEGIVINVNGKKTYAYEFYAPKQGDLIEISLQ